MRKFLAVLLIAAIACTEVVDTEVAPEFNDVELKNWLDGLKKGWNALTSGVKKAVNWLKEKGYWDTIVKAAKTAGKLAAKALCAKYTSGDTCGQIVDALL